MQELLTRKWEMGKWGKGKVGNGKTAKDGKWGNAETSENQVSFLHGHACDREHEKL